MKTRMQPIGNIWGQFPRTVRDVALGCGKEVGIEMEGQRDGAGQDHYRGDQGSADPSGAKFRRPRNRASGSAGKSGQGSSWTADSARLS